MLDILSGGRLNFGVGRGVILQHFEGFRTDPRESRARYEESLQIIRGAWIQDPFAYEPGFGRIGTKSVGRRRRKKDCNSRSLRSSHFSEPNQGLHRFELAKEKSDVFAVQVD